MVAIAAGPESSVAASSAVTDSPKVPPELVVELLRYVHDGPSSLSACSLTCRSWAEEIRRNRFRQVALEYSNIHAFHDLIQHAPTVGSYVKHLYIQIERADDVLWQLQQHEVVKDIAGRMRDVRSLKLVCYLVTPTTVSSLASLFSAVELSLGMVFSLRAEDIASLIRSFSVLKILIVEDIVVVPSTNLCATTKPSAYRAFLSKLGIPRLNHTTPLPLETVSSDDLVHLNSWICNEMFRESHGYNLNLAAAHKFGTILQGVGASLEGLIIRLPTPPRATWIFSGVWLGALRSPLESGDRRNGNSVRVIIIHNIELSRWRSWLPGFDTVLAREKFLNLEQDTPDEIQDCLMMFMTQASLGAGENDPDIALINDLDAPGPRKPHLGVHTNVSKHWQQSRAFSYKLWLPRPAVFPVIEAKQILNKEELILEITGACIWADVNDLAPGRKFGLEIGGSPAFALVPLFLPHFTGFSVPFSAHRFALLEESLVPPHTSLLCRYVTLCACRTWSRGSATTSPSSSFPSCI
ncbi:uncharacterized protein FIBRA_01269 [Fibroporia radiculosa]|uniref:F-box domain-containing protein n=1 Tax=Fibroporia radiculosa TaxID=599839 RepID=J4H104_9APHY|nr:uncharacterized protein FIBRA_01269 [Fibroporia radiculosa]CCL99254.1 predicted protein [Fibroporia radiculosa]